MGAEEGCRFVCCCSPATTRIACSGGRRLVRCSRTLARGAATPAPKRGSRGRRPRRSAAPPSAGCEPVAATVADSLGLPFIWHLACLLHPLEKHALPGSPPPPLPPAGQPRRPGNPARRLAAPGCTAHPSSPPASTLRAVGTHLFCAHVEGVLLHQLVLQVAQVSMEVLGLHSRQVRQGRAPSVDNWPADSAGGGAEALPCRLPGHQVGVPYTRLGVRGYAAIIPGPSSAKQHATHRQRPERRSPRPATTRLALPLWLVA